MTPPAPRRVLMTADTMGGVWTFAVDLCAVLGRFGVQVTLVTMGRQPDVAQMQQIRSLANVTLIPTDYKLEWMDSCSNSLIESGEFLLRIESSLRPDIIHVNGYWHASLPFEAPILVTAHSCVSSWWKACRGTPLPSDWSGYKRWIAQAVSASDLVIAPTRAYLEEFCDHHGKPKRSCVIWNGRPGALFRPGTKRHIVLGAGRLWDDAKNMSLLCHAAEGLDIPIVLAGEFVAPDGRIFEPTGVAALGRLSPKDTAKWMSEASIFAAPARYEPFGLCILEAALSGCALVLGDIPSLRELWDGVATFVKPDDITGLRRAIKMLADAPHLANSDGAKARERALQYTAEAMGHAYFAAYRVLLADNHQAVETIGDVAA